MAQTHPAAPFAYIATEGGAVKRPPFSAATTAAPPAGTAAMHVTSSTGIQRTMSSHVVPASPAVMREGKSGAAPTVHKTPAGSRASGGASVASRGRRLSGAGAGTPGGRGGGFRGASAGLSQQQLLEDLAETAWQARTLRTAKRAAAASRLLFSSNAGSRSQASARDTGSTANSRRSARVPAATTFIKTSSTKSSIPSGSSPYAGSVAISVPAAAPAAGAGSCVASARTHSGRCFNGKAAAAPPENVEDFVEILETLKDQRRALSQESDDTLFCILLRDDDPQAVDLSLSLELLRISLLSTFASTLSPQTRAAARRRAAGAGIASPSAGGATVSRDALPAASAATTLSSTTATVGTATANEWAAEAPTRGGGAITTTEHISTAAGAEAAEAGAEAEAEAEAAAGTEETLEEGGRKEGSRDARELSCKKGSWLSRGVVKHCSRNRVPTLRSRGRRDRIVTSSTHTTRDFAAAAAASLPASILPSRAKSLKDYYWRLQQCPPVLAHAQTVCLSSNAACIPHLVQDSKDTRRDRFFFDGELLAGSQGFPRLVANIMRRLQGRRRRRKFAAEGGASEGPDMQISVPSCGVRTPLCSAAVAQEEGLQAAFPENTNATDIDSSVTSSYRHKDFTSSSSSSSASSSAAQSCSTSVHPSSSSKRSLSTTTQCSEEMVVRSHGGFADFDRPCNSAAPHLSAAGGAADATGVHRATGATASPCAVAANPHTSGRPPPPATTTASAASSCASSASAASDLCEMVAVAPLLKGNEDTAEMKQPTAAVAAGKQGVSSSSSRNSTTSSSSDCEDAKEETLLLLLLSLLLLHLQSRTYTGGCSVDFVFPLFACSPFSLLVPLPTESVPNQLIFLEDACCLAAPTTSEKTSVTRERTTGRATIASSTPGEGHLTGITETLAREAATAAEAAGSSGNLLDSAAKREERIRSGHTAVNSDENVDVVARGTGETAVRNERVVSRVHSPSRPVREDITATATGGEQRRRRREAAPAPSAAPAAAAGEGPRTPPRTGAEHVLDDAVAAAAASVAAASTSACEEEEDTLKAVQLHAHMRYRLQLSAAAELEPHTHGCAEGVEEKCLEEQQQHAFLSSVRIDVHWFGWLDLAAVEANVQLLRTIHQQLLQQASESAQAHAIWESLKTVAAAVAAERPAAVASDMPAASAAAVSVAAPAASSVAAGQPLSRRPADVGANMAAGESGSSVWKPTGEEMVDSERRQQHEEQINSPPLLRQCIFVKMSHCDMSGAQN